MTERDASPELNPAVEGPLGEGEAIAFVRVTLDSARRREKLLQRELYDRCTAIEAAMFPEGPRRPKLYFNAVADSKYAERKIQKIERSEGQALQRRQLGVIARAFELPDDFFLVAYTDLAALSSAYAAVFSGSASANASARPRETRLAEPPAIGFSRLGSKQPLVDDRQPIAEQLSGWLQDLGGGAALVLVEGAEGVGKRFFANRWFQDQGRRHALGGALMIDCAPIAVEDLAVEIENRFPRGGAADGPKVIVLDNVSLSRFREGGTHGPGVDAPSLSSLIQQAEGLARQLAPVFLIVLLHNYGEPVDDALLLRDLGSIRFERVELSRLQPSQGADLLTRLGVKGFDRAAFEEISALVMGLPNSLASVAFELEPMAQQDREQYLERLRSGDARNARGGSAFEAFLVRYLGRLSGDQIFGFRQATQHPHALLRLVSLMPGPLPLSHLQAILADRKLVRLLDYQIGHARDLRNPLLWVEDDAIHIHALARAALRAELADFRDNERWDAVTNRRELEWLHWRRTQLLWPTMEGLNWAGESRSPDATMLEAVEGVVFHICEQIHLLPREGGQAAPRRRQRPALGPSARDLENFRTREGQLSDAMLWQIAYQKVARPMLLDRHFRATRIHGQYSTKARVLGYLLHAAKPFDPEEGARRKAGLRSSGRAPIQADDQAELFKEIGICHMHAGRLSAARVAIDHAAAILRQQHPEVLEAVVTEEDATPHWAKYCEILSASTAIRIRLGDVASEVSGALDTLLQKSRRLSEGLIATASEARPPQKQLFFTDGERGTLRLMTRAAELLLLRDGDVEGAKAAFAEVSRLVRFSRRRELEGEAARRWVQALVRGGGEGRIHQARDIIAANLAQQQAGGRSGKGAETIPIRLLEVTLDRVEGQYERARTGLSTLAQDEAFRRHQCTFAAQIEYELEILRLKLATEEDRSAVFHDATDLAMRLADVGHWMMETEALLLAAEAADDNDRIRLLASVRARLARAGWRMRMADAQLIEDGKSAVRSLGA